MLTSCTLKPRKFHVHTRWHHISHVYSVRLVSLYLCAKVILGPQSRDWRYQLLAGSTTGMQNYDVENEEEWGDLPLNTSSPMKILELFCMMGLFIISSIITSCSNNDEELLQTSQTEQTSMDVVTLKSIINFDDGDFTRALTETGEKTFAAGDMIAVVYSDMSDNIVKTSAYLTASKISTDGKKATIEILGKRPKSNSEVKYIYPAGMANDDGTVNYDVLATQDGSLATLAKKIDLCTFTGMTTEGGDLPTNVTLVNQLAICKFTVKNGSSEDINGTVSTLVVGDGINTYKVTRSASADPIWVAMQPVSSDRSIWFAADDGAGKPYYKSVSGKTLSASKIYPISVKMGEVSTLADLKTCLNFGFMVGKYCGYYVNSSGEIHPSDVEGDIGRVAATGHYAQDTYSGASDTRILVLALTDAGECAWKNEDTEGESAYNSTEEMNGLDFCYNHNFLSYPAAYNAYNWSTSRPNGSTNWFLPSILQWLSMLGVANMEGTGQISKNTLYWSATEYSSDSSQAYTFCLSETYGSVFVQRSKTAQFNVRACFAY